MKRRHWLLVGGALLAAVGNLRGEKEAERGDLKHPEPWKLRPRLTEKEQRPVNVLKAFLTYLAHDQDRRAYELVAPSSREGGDPIAYQAALDFESFVRELAPGGDGADFDPTFRNKFADYQLGAFRWESPERFRIFLDFGGDRDEALMVFEKGMWFVADPIHIIR